MKKQKMKKIKFETAAIILVILIIAVNVQAKTETYQLENENNLKFSYPYFIIGKGYIWDMKLDEEKNKIGILDGNLQIHNKPGWSAPENYKLMIIDKYNKKIITKNTLPEEFTLMGFIGLGYIKYVSIPHHLDATKYFIMGKAIDILE
jgi:hypothetical protein